MPAESRGTREAAQAQTHTSQPNRPDGPCAGRQHPAPHRVSSAGRGPCAELTNERLLLQQLAEVSNFWPLPTERSTEWSAGPRARRTRSSSPARVGTESLPRAPPGHTAGSRAEGRSAGSHFTGSGHRPLLPGEGPDRKEGLSGLPASRQQTNTQWQLADTPRKKLRVPRTAKIKRREESKQEECSGRVET